MRAHAASLAALLLHSPLVGCMCCVNAAAALNVVHAGVYPAGSRLNHNTCSVVEEKGNLQLY